MGSWSWQGAALAAAALASTCSIHTHAARSSQGEAAGAAGRAAAQGGGIDRRAARPPDLDDRARSLARRIDERVAARAPQPPGARIGIAIRDLDSGMMLYERDADGLYNAASNTRLVTASAALAALGPDFLYYTALYGGAGDSNGVLDGDVDILGRGATSLGTSLLYLLARETRLQ